MTASSPGVEVRRLLSASPEKVFAAFTDQALVAQWLPSRVGADLRHEQGWRGALDLLEALLRRKARDGN